MQSIKIFLLGFVSIVICQTRLDYNSEACTNYLKKFSKSQTGILPTSLSFTGNSELSSDKSSVIINLRYTDSLFNDVTYFGLTQEDGKSPEQTCLDLQLWKFTSTSYSDPLQVTDLPFTPSSNLQWRYLSFTIKETDLATRLVQSSNSNFYIYTGYYYISYYAAGTTQLQYTFYFQFSVTVSKSKGTLISTTFRPFNIQELKGCANGGCTVSPSTQLKWCKDSTCSDNLIPELYLYQSFYIQQIVTASSLKSYYLIDTVVLFIGDGMNQQITPKSIDNSKAGQVILLLTANFVWSELSIQVISYLSTTQTGNRLLQEAEDTLQYDSFRGRLLTSDQIIYDPISGVITYIPCIKMDYFDSTCPLCTDECKANNFARKECSQCSESRLAFDSESCNNYLKKFGTADIVNGIGPTTLSFTGESSESLDKSSVIIMLRYTDSLFNDATYFGLTQEDGKTADQTCLDLKLWKFSSNSYSDPLQVTDLLFKASTNLQKQWRYLFFSIKNDDLSSRLVKSSNSNSNRNQYVYIGYYAIAYYAAGTTQLQYNFYFRFSVTISKLNNAATFTTFTTFTPFNQWETQGCTVTGPCTISPSSELNFCSDTTCSTIFVQDAYLYRQLCVQQIVKTESLKKYYLTDSVVLFIGDGLIKQTIPISIDNSNAGQVILQLNFDILWSNLSIQITSYLSTTQTGNRLLEDKSQSSISGRLLSSDQIYDPISGISSQITCIKMHSGDDQCATCSEQCKVNGFAMAECSECHYRLDINSDGCQNYLKKFGTINPQNGQGPTFISYTGEASFKTEASNLMISLRYYDSLFNDAKYWGLVQEEGKIPEDTCLDLKIWKFASISYNDPVQVIGLNITTQSNIIKKLRYLTFMIKSGDFSTKLVQSSNSNYYVYNGYYAIAYYAAETEKNLYTFYFQFSVTVLQSNGTIISTTFSPFNQYETIGCAILNPCNVTYSSYVKWCTDLTCLFDKIPNLHYYEKFFIQQVVTSNSFSDYYLVNTVVTLIGDGLNIEIQPISLDNSKPGQVTLLLYIHYLWNNFRIRVTSYLSTSLYGDNQIYDPVSGLTETITCIKMNSDVTTCPTCNDECRINSFARSECKECHDRLDPVSFACNKYEKKFDNTDSDIIPTTLSFTGDTIVAIGNQDIIVSLRYFDSLSTDATYFGLTQEDGKTPETTCLDLKLWKYSDNFVDPVEITDLLIKGSLDKSKKYRFLNFTINGTDFTTRLIQSVNSDYYIYNGYYAIGYYQAISDRNIYTFYFQFSVTVSKLNRTILSTFFKPFNQWETQNCSITGPCNVSPSSQLKWCTDASCSINTIPNLYLFDQFYLQQIVTIQSLQNYYLINTTVYYVGNGLIKQTKPIKINNNQPGKVLLLLNADVAWSNISIQVISYISTTSKGTRLLTEEGRLLATKTIIYDPVLGITQPITCIMMIPYDTECPSCVDECEINGFAQEGCVCSNNNTNIPDYQIPNIDSLLNIIIIIYLII